MHACQALLLHYLGNIGLHAPTCCRTVRKDWDLLCCMLSTPHTTRGLFVYMVLIILAFAKAHTGGVRYTRPWERMCAELQECFLCRAGGGANHTIRNNVFQLASFVTLKQDAIVTGQMFASWRIVSVTRIHCLGSK
jgi:hypothetical protein